MNMNEDKNAWMGKKGFDEAYYYEDRKTDIGLTYSDETIMAKIHESLDRNLHGITFEVNSDEGNVDITGPGKDLESKVISVAKDIAGVKSVHYSLSSS